jgi:hypothetical protein
MSRCVQWMKANAGSLALFGAAGVLFALLFAADDRLGLYQKASNRVRFHAIPVAISELYHNRQHDYTAFRTLAHRFHDSSRPLDEQIAEAIRSDPGTDTYYWVADDRGLSDFVLAAFRLFGPQTRSLSNFWFLLLAFGVGLFVLGYWNKPSALVLPVQALFGLLVLAEWLPFREQIPFDDHVWQGQVALYESRLFDALALVSVLHLALVIVLPKMGRFAFATAIPQAALLVFLYHARSSLGSEYLALFVLILARIGWCLLRRERGQLAGPLFVAGLLGLSLVGLKCYQHAVYDPAYFADRGNRTFWHNALMGLSHDPRLRKEVPMRHCEDRDAVDLILARMYADNPNLDPKQWNAQSALNSLGSHNAFDWPAYEATARDIYFDLWRTRPGEMFVCYAVYKPYALARQVWAELRVAGREMIAGRAWEAIAGLGVLLAVSVGLFRAGRGDEALRGEVRALSFVLLALVPFALIPAIAFYPAITTTGAFFVMVLSLGSLVAVQAAWRIARA